jgi:serine/threonine protein kinase
MAELRAVVRGGERGVRKVVRADQAGNPVYRELLRIEDLALQRLAGVPEVVRRLDSGDGWLVLEVARPVPEPTGWAEARVVLERVGRALTACHAAGVLHRDPKRANLLATERGVVLGDFGAARIDGIADPAPGLGSPEAFAPERLAGGPATDATDRYAAGVLAWELITGALPFPTVRWSELLALHAAGLPPFVPRWPVPEGVEGRIRALLSADPGARPDLSRWG